MRTYAYILALLVPTSVGAQPFVDVAFTERSPDNDPDLVVVREKYDAETNRQSLYLRSYDATPDHTVLSGLIEVRGATVAEVVFDGAALEEADAAWALDGHLERYGPAEGRGLEGEVIDYAPAVNDRNDHLSFDASSVRFWLGTGADVDDLRIVLQYPAEPASASVDVTLYGGRRPDPDGFAVSTQGGIQVGSLEDREVDDGDYSEVFDLSRLKLLIEDLDIVEDGISLGAVEMDGPATPAQFSVDNFGEGTDVDQDNGFDQNGVRTPIPTATSLDNLELVVADLETERGDVIDADELVVEGLPMRLAAASRTAVDVSLDVPVDTPDGIYVGRITVFEDNNADGIRNGGEPADRVRVAVIVGTPPDGGFDLGVADAGLPDGFVEPPDAGPDAAEPDAGPDAAATDALDSDAAANDLGADAGGDALADGSADAGVDGATDGPAADGPEPDAPVPDVGLDAELDARADAEADAEADGSPDAVRRDPGALEPIVFDPGDARGGAFSCATRPGAPTLWVALLVLPLLVRRRRG